MSGFRVVFGATATVSLVLLISGCQSNASSQQRRVDFAYPHARAETLTETPEQHYQRISRISANDSRALIEDLDLLFMTDRSSRLTRWHDR